ncbi:TPR-like protein, partial [Rhizoclosmatium globosum]
MGPRKPMVQCFPPLSPFQSINEPLSDPNAMSTLGLPFSHFKHLVEAWGGRSALTGKTTTDICFEFVKPMTTATGLSLCAHYKSTHSTSQLVQESQWFISHAWMYPFLTVIDALQHWITENNLDESTTILWFDLFSNSQHNTAAKPFHWWQTTFLTAIKKMKNVVMILEPVHDPIPLKRAWCIFELYACIKTSSEFHVAMAPTQASKFLESLKRDPAEFYNLLAAVNTETAQATNPADLAKISQIVREEVGYIEMDRMVFRVFNEWIVKRLQDLVDASDSDALLGASWKYALGRIFKARNEYEKAILLYQDCIATWKENGEEGEVIVASIALGSLLNDTGKWKESVEMMDSILERDNLPQELELGAKAVLGLALIKQGQAERALSVNESCFQLASELFGPKHERTLMAQNNLALCYSSFSREQEALKLYESSTALLEETFGPDHNLVHTTLSNVAQLKLRMGAFNEAETLFTRILDKQMRVFGLKHSQTLSTMNSLGGVYQALQRWEEAESMFKQCIQERTVFLGENHADTLNSMHNLGHFYVAQNRLQEAEPILRSCLEKLKATLGKHVSTLITMNALGDVMEKLGNEEEAEQLYLMATSAGQDILPESHPQTYISWTNLALLYYTQNRLREAEPFLVMNLEFHMKYSPLNKTRCLLLETLGMLYEKAGLHSVASDYYLQCLNARRELQGANHEDTMATLERYAKRLFKDGDFAKSEPYLTQLLEYHRETRGSQDFKTIDALQDVILLHEKLGNAEEREKFNEELIQILMIRTGRDRDAVLVVLEKNRLKNATN